MCVAIAGEWRLWMLAPAGTVGVMSHMDGTSEGLLVLSFVR